MKRIFTLLLTFAFLLILAAPAMPVEFTPSVESKEAPEIVEMTDEEGNACDAVIETEEETIAVGEDHSIALAVTPIAKADEAPSAEVAQSMVEALNSVMKANSVADLVPKIVDKVISTGYKADDFMVVDVFAVSLVKDNVEVIPVPEGAKLKFRFQTDLKSNDLFYLLRVYAPGLWEIVEDVMVDEKGVITAVVPDTAPFAIIRLAKDVLSPDITPGGTGGTGTGGTGTGGTGTGGTGTGGTGTVDPGTLPPSPQTGDPFPAGYLACALLCLCAAAVLIFKAGKRA